MKEDRGIVLDALRRQREALVTALENGDATGAQVAYTIMCIDAEIARRTQPRKPSGRPRTPHATLRTLRDLLHQGTPKKHAAKQLGIARSTLYRLLATEEVREP